MTPRAEDQDLRETCPACGAWHFDVDTDGTIRMHRHRSGIGLCTGMAKHVTVTCCALECGEALRTSIPEPPRHSPTAWRAATEEAQTAGWSTFTIGKSAYPRLAVHCPACTARRADRGETCGHCVHGGLYDLIGHDEHGHRIANSLMRAGIGTVRELRGCSDEELRDVRGLGERWVARLRTTIERPDDTLTPGERNG